MMRVRLVLSAVTLTAALVGAGPTAMALAAGPVTPTQAASPARASVRLYLPDAFFLHGQPVTVPDRGFHVVGIVQPYVAGQWVSVRGFVGRRLIRSDRLRVKPSRDHRFGQFTERLASPRAGRVVVNAVHGPTPQMLGFLGRRSLSSLAENVGFGSRGMFVELVQQHLAALHFYLPQSGVYDQFTGLAVDAYHRLLGRGFSQNLDGVTISALLDGRGSFTVRYPHDGAHVEGDLGRQLLALIYGSKVYRIYPVSSGKPSTPTVLGHFHVYQRTPGYLPDGMYYSDFFYGGYAIHGYDPAPDYPASHGCMRLPIVDAISVYNWLTYGDVVDVYS